MKMAELGDYRNVDVSSTEIKRLVDCDDSENFYNSYPDDVPVFTLGKPAEDSVLSKFICSNNKNCFLLNAAAWIRMQPV